MANENAKRDDNRVTTLLYVDSATGEVRRLTEKVLAGIDIATTVNGNANNTDGSSTVVIAAQGAGVATYLTDITLTNMSATDVYVEIKDGSTAKWTFPVPAGGGVTYAFKTPLKGSVNTAWNFDPSSAVSTIYCSASGFVGA